MAVCLWNNNCYSRTIHRNVDPLLPIITLQWFGGVALITGMAEGLVEVMTGKSSYTLQIGK